MPWMKNATLTNHTPTEIVQIIPFFFHIAILAATMRVLFRKIIASEDVRAKHDQQ